MRDPNMCKPDTATSANSGCREGYVPMCAAVPPAEDSHLCISLAATALPQTLGALAWQGIRRNSFVSPLVGAVHAPVVASASTIPDPGPSCHKAMLQHKSTWHESGAGGKRFTWVAVGVADSPSAGG